MHIECDGTADNMYDLWIDDQPWTFKIVDSEVIDYWFDGDSRMQPAPDYERAVVNAVEGWVNSEDQDYLFHRK